MLAFYRITLAALAGWLVYLSYEPHGYWWCAIAGIALLFLALSPWSPKVTGKIGLAGAAQERPSAAFGALLGFVHGVASTSTCCRGSANLSERCPMLR